MRAVKRKPKVVFVNRFFWPDESATSQILSDVCEHLAASGWGVTVITSRLSYSNPSDRFSSRQTWKNVKIVRVRTSGFGRGNIIGRALDYFSFYLSSFFSLLRHVRSGDILVMKTDPPLISIPAGVAGRIRGARRINWLQDLFPEVATSLGMRLPFGFFLRSGRNRSLNTATTNIVIGETMAARLRKLGVQENKIETIANFADEISLSPDANGIHQLRAKWGIETEDFIVGYSGNLGRAHEFETVLGAAEILKDDPRLKFLFVGGGQLRQLVEGSVAERGLSNVIFRPYQPRSELAISLGVPDLHWVSLRPELEGLIVPSKIYGVAAVGRPIIMIGDRNGEVGSLLAQHDFGFTVPPSASLELSALIRDLSADRDTARRLGANARKFAQTVGARSTAFRRWAQLLRDLG